MKFLKKEYTIKKTVGGVLLDAIVGGLIFGFAIYFSFNNIDLVSIFDAARFDKEFSIMFSLGLAILFCIICILIELAIYFEQKEKGKKKKVEKK